MPEIYRRAALAPPITLNILKERERVADLDGRGVSGTPIIAGRSADGLI
jgi:hypothetical protein